MNVFAFLLELNLNLFFQFLDLLYKFVDLCAIEDSLVATALSDLVTYKTTATPVSRFVRM